MFLELEKDLPTYKHNRNYSVSSKNKRYFNQHSAWEDDDQQFDEELEQKHTALLMEEFYSTVNPAGMGGDKTSSKMSSQSRQKKRKSFDIDIQEIAKVIQTEQSPRINENHNLSPIKEYESPVIQGRMHHGEKDPDPNDCSDMVWIDSSIEERKKSVRRSKTKIEKFKEMVNRSDSKHMSSLISLNICETESNSEGYKSVQISDSFSFLPQNFDKLNYKPKKAELENVDQAVEVMRQKLRIDNDQKTCLLLPKIKWADNYGVRPAVYDFIYMMSGVSEPKLEYFPAAFTD